MRLPAPSDCAVRVPRRGRASTSAARSTTRAKPSRTLQSICRHRDVTVWRPRRSTRSRSWCVPPAAGPSACSPRCVQPSPRPRRCANDSPRARTRARAWTASSSFARGRTRPRPWCDSLPATPGPACSAPSRSGKGVDVPGSACQLVIIDRIPFPRPDDPLSSARSQAIARMGGNGFMAVPATPAALRLAQGSGRLVRRGDDRGVVAILDPRMITARYAGFLQKSLPPFWPTTDKALVLAALKRLDETADEPLPVHVPAPRGVAGAFEDPSIGDGDDDRPVEPAADERPVADDPPVAVSARTAVTQGHAWTPEQDTELREAVDLGLTLGELAEHLELEESVIAARLSLFGLELSDSPKMAF